MATMSDLELLAYVQNMSEKLTLSPTTYNCTAPMAVSYAGYVDAFASAMAAIDPNDRSKTLVNIKNAARTDVKYQTNLIINQVNASATVTTAQKMELGINPRAIPTPQPVPASEPTLKVLSVDKWSVTARLSDSVDVAKRGKPVGVIGAAVYSYVGETPPADLSAWKFEGNVGKVKILVNFPTTLAPGTRVYLTAQWFNGRKQAGPACDPVPTNLQGGSVSSMAA